MALSGRDCVEERVREMQNADPAEDRKGFVSDNSRQRSLFSILNDRTREAFIERCKLITFEPGEPIFEQGSEHEYSYIIKSGAIRTYYLADSGREITLGHWSEGDLVGGPYVFGGGYHVWSAVAKDVSEVLAITGPALRDFAALHAHVYPWIVDVLSFKLRWVSILFQIHGTENAQQRLIKLLIMLGDFFGIPGPDGIVIQPKISQQDLASLLGVSRQWTNRTLTRLRNMGVVVKRDNRFVIQDIAGLKAMIGNE